MSSVVIFFCRLIFICLLVNIQSYILLAQPPKVANSFDVVNNTRPVLSNEILIGKAIPPAERKGTYYLNQNWSNGKIVFINNEIIEDVPIRYHIENDQFETKVEEGKIFVYDGFIVKNYITTNEFGQEQFFIYCKDCVYNNSTLVGLFEVIEPGKIKLLKKHRISIKPSTYVHGKDMGDRDEKIMIKEDYYLVEGNVVKKIRNNGKWNLAQFPLEKQSELVKFAKKNNLNFKKINDLKEIMNFCNTWN